MRGYVIVPVEPTDEMIEAGKKAAGLIYDARARACWSAMLTAAPVREEGGADAWRIRTKENLHGDGEPAGRWIVSNILSLSSDTAHWYEIQPLRVSEPSPADLDNMAAYGVRLALAAREEAPAGHHERNLSMTNGQLIEQALSHPPLEAPAEAGELASQIDILRKAANSPIPNEDARLTFGSAMKSAQAWRTIASNVVSAFDRAQPQAREDAQPVGWKHTDKCWGKTSYSDEMAHCYCQKEQEKEASPQPVGWLRPDTLKGLMDADESVVGIQSLVAAHETKHNTVAVYTHPATDALRVAVEALEAITDLSVNLRQGGPDSSDLNDLSDALNTAVDVAHEALAALQAEQKGGA